MLALSRKKGEEVQVTLPDGRVGRVVLLDVDRNKVRIGFDFPDDVKLLRSELIEKIREVDP